MTDIIRVLRVLEYVGEREAVESHLRSVLYGEKSLPKYSIRGVTVGVVPDVIKTWEHTLPIQTTSIPTD